MFSNVTVGLIFAVGFAAWVYSKMHRQTGGNNQTALIVAGAAAFISFLLIVITLGALFPS
jgi:hypothetical protein